MQNPDANGSLKKVLDFVERITVFIQNVVSGENADLERMPIHGVGRQPHGAVDVIAGGFGNALEADIRAPGSTPLACENALRALREADIRDAAIAAATSPASRARLCCTAWNLAIGRSKAVRSLA